MPVKIRLSRKGKKSYAYYHIVVADSRAPRDGRYIERIGSYNPNTDPATIHLNFDSALKWLKCGAVPTDTCRSILSREGVLMKKHLLDGVKKGAFEEDEAERKYDIWKKDKELKQNLASKEIEEKSKVDAKKRLEAEAKVNEERAQEIAKKQKEKLEAQAKAAAEENAENAEATENTEETESTEEKAPEEKPEA